MDRLGVKGWFISVHFRSVRSRGWFISVHFRSVRSRGWIILVRLGVDVVNHFSSVWFGWVRSSRGWFISVQLGSVRLGVEVGSF